jgi:hypothetical protein
MTPPRERLIFEHASDFKKKSIIFENNP